MNTCTSMVFGPIYGQCYKCRSYLQEYSPMGLCMACQEEHMAILLELRQAVKEQQK